MLSRSHRFHGHSSVRQVYHRGRAVRSGFGSLHYEANPKRREYRAAVVVSKKVDKSAVSRNRIRRRVYELLRHQAERFDRPYDLVLTVHESSAATMPATELEAQVMDLLAGRT